MPSEDQTDVSDAVIGILQIQDNAARRGALTLWTIYDKPKDYPHGICARRHEVGNGKSVPTEHMLFGELELLRRVFREAGLTRITRAPEDDAKIVETWI